MTTLKDSRVGLNNITADVHLFIGYQKPNGFICPERECHGLFYYYLLAQNTFEREEDGYVLEGEIDFVGNYRQLFTTIATLYGVQPEKMVKHWECVDMQCVAVHLPKLKDIDALRHNYTPEIRTQ